MYYLTDNTRMGFPFDLPTSPTEEMFNSLFREQTEKTRDQPLNETLQREETRDISFSIPEPIRDAELSTDSFIDKNPTSERLRGWFFTDFDVNQENINKWIKYFENPRITYAIIGAIETCPTTGNQHIHGGWRSKDWTTFKALKKKFPKAKFFAKKADKWDQLIDYVTKDGEALFVKGTPPADRDQQAEAGRQQGAKAKETWALMLDLAKAGKWNILARDYPKEYVLHHQKLLSAANLVHMNPDIESDNDEDGLTYKTVPCYWFYGETGTGKSLGAKALWKGTINSGKPKLYIKALNKWWDNYFPGQGVHIEEVQPSHAEIFAPFFKIWCDRYQFKAEIKGGSMEIRPPFFVFTSNHHPRKVLASLDEADSNAILRRLTIYKVNNLGDLNGDNYTDYNNKPAELLYPLKYIGESGRFDATGWKNEFSSIDNMYTETLNY